MHALTPIAGSRFDPTPSLLLRLKAFRVGRDRRGQGSSLLATLLEQAPVVLVTYVELRAGSTAGTNVVIERRLERTWSICKAGFQTLH
eukprot:scaffold249583_cov48-Prasinocladus_malaysianus.AAC.1